jgi:hypothetical protein
MDNPRLRTSESRAPGLLDSRSCRMQHGSLSTSLLIVLLYAATRNSQHLLAAPPSLPSSHHPHLVPTMLSRTATHLLRRSSSSTIKSVLPPLSAVSLVASRSSRRSVNPSNVRSFSATKLRREQDATRQEINTPPSLYTFTEEEEMLRDTGGFLRSQLNVV